MAEFAPLRLGTCHGDAVHILVVEDDDDAIADPLVRGLRREGFPVERVATGGQALEVRTYDMVLLDLGARRARSSSA